MKKYILDSGAFTAFNKGTKIDIDEYIEFVRLHSDLFDYCISLDVIGNAKDSYHNWKYIQSKGVNVIPVFHLGTDEKWLLRYLKQTDYIGIGAIAKLNTNQRVMGLTRIWKDYLIDSNQKAKVKVHGLGLTSIGIVLRYPWYSLDSASCIKNAGFGSIFLPSITKGKDNPNYFSLISVRISDQAKVQTGIRNTFLAQPKIIQEQYIELFKEIGIKLGTLTYQTIRPRRLKSVRRKSDPPKLFTMPISPPEEGQTLANSVEARYKWNLHYWEKLVERIPSYDRKFDPTTLPREEINTTNKKVNVYTVCNTTKYLQIALDTIQRQGVLLSYVATNDNLIKMLQHEK